MRNLRNFLITCISFSLLGESFSTLLRSTQHPPRLSLRGRKSDNSIFSDISKTSSVSSSPSSCLNEGTKTHDGCNDPMYTQELNDDESDRFDMFELARSWTPGFCASSSFEDGASKTKKKMECKKEYLKNEMTVHGLWPSYSEPFSDPALMSSTRNKQKKCYWPQNCRMPPGYPRNESFHYDEDVLPKSEEFKRLAPAWYYDGLAEHEWEKHGTCAMWPAKDDSSMNNDIGEEEKIKKSLTQRNFYAGMFQLAKNLGTPDKLPRSAGKKVPLDALKHAFSELTPVIAAFGCDSRCNFVQIVQCFKRPSSSHADSSSSFIGQPMDCPCVGVRDSRYDNSCESQCKDGVYIIDAAEK